MVPFQSHGVTVDAFGVLCAQLTRDMFAEAKFLVGLSDIAFPFDREFLENGKSQRYISKQASVY